MNRYLYPALIVLFGVLVYANALATPFQYDDLGLIVNDPTIGDLWKPGTHPNRFVATFSLKLDYAIAGMDPHAFHRTNIAIHIAAALMLFGVVRRTLRQPRFEGLAPGVADSIGFAVAAIWVVHPLNTQAVTYVWQRCESLMGLFFLTVIYAAVRMAEGRRSVLWGTVVIVALLLGLASKEVMVSVMPLLLLYDGVLLSPSFKSALRARRPIYVLFAVIAIVGLVFVAPRIHTSFGRVSSVDYALSQPGIVLEYLRLALWPSPLCFDYARQPAVGLLAIGLPLMVVIGLLGWSVRALIQRRWQGVAGAWFFLILAPTSSFVVINDLMIEYRMYLPLIAVIALVVAGGRALCARFSVPPVLPLVAVVIGLAATTVRRNQDYATQISLWKSVLEVEPESVRAHSYLVPLLLNAGRAEEAVEHAEDAVALDPSRLTHWNYGSALRDHGNYQQALEQFEIVAARRPDDAAALRQIGNVLVRLGRFEEAVASLERSIALSPENGDSHALIAQAYEVVGRRGDAERACRRALELDPARVGTWRRLGNLLVAARRNAEAAVAYRHAVELRPNEAQGLLDLAGVTAELGAHEEAFALFERGLRADPSRARFVSDLSVKVASARGSPERLAMALRVADLAATVTGRREATVLVNLARCHRTVGRVDVARAIYDEALALPSITRDAVRRAELRREQASLGGH